MSLCLDKIQGSLEGDASPNTSKNLMVKNGAASEALM